MSDDEAKLELTAPKPLWGLGIYRVLKGHGHPADYRPHVCVTASRGYSRAGTWTLGPYFIPAAIFTNYRLMRMKGNSRKGGSEAEDWSRHTVTHAIDFYCFCIHTWSMAQWLKYCTFKYLPLTRHVFAQLWSGAWNKTHFRNNLPNTYLPSTVNSDQEIQGSISIEDIFLAEFISLCPMVSLFCEALPIL